MRQISRTAEYALRAVVCLAGSRQGPLVAPHIARITRVPPGYLRKVLQVLGRAGLVRSQRGLRGGFTLARQPDELTVLEVIHAVEPPRRRDRCPLGLAQHEGRPCGLHRRLSAAAEASDDALGRCTIADVMSDTRGSTPMHMHLDMHHRSSAPKAPADTAGGDP